MSKDQKPLKSHERGLLLFWIVRELVKLPYYVWRAYKRWRAKQHAPRPLTDEEIRAKKQAWRQQQNDAKRKI